MKKRNLVLLGLGVVVVIAAVMWFSRPASTPAPPAPPPVTVAPLTEQTVFFIARSNAGEHGQEVACGDSVVSLERWVSSEGSVLLNTYRDLLSLKDQTYQQTGLYNALWQSNLEAVSAAVDAGVATIQLTGQMRLTDNCDAARIIEQLERPALQFEGVTSVNITLNGQPIEASFTAAQRALLHQEVESHSHE